MTPPNNAAATSFEVGDLVEVLPRTWAGINKPGGTGRVTRVHYSTGFVESVDVAYVIGAQKDKKVDLEYIKPHVQLERLERSRRGRDFFKACPAQGVRRTKQEEQRTSSHRAAATRKAPKRRKISMTAATKPSDGFNPRDDKNKGNAIMMVDVDESEACNAPPEFAALADVPVLEIEIPTRSKESDCISPMDVANRFMRLESQDEESYEPYRLDDIQTDQIVPRPSPKELLARHENHAKSSRNIGDHTDPTHATSGAKRSLYAASEKRGKSNDKDDDQKPSSKTDRKSLARSQSDSKLPSALRFSQSAKSNRRKNNLVKTPSARRILPLQKYRKPPAAPVTQSPLEEAPRRRKPFQQIIQNRVDTAQKFVRAVVSGKRSAPPTTEVEPDPPEPTVDPSRLEIFRNNLSRLWEGGDDDVIEKDQIILDLNKHLMTKGITARIFTQSEIDDCLKTLEDEGILMLGAADQHVYRI